MPQSPNKAVISALVETFQRKLEPHKVYDAMRKMNDDLNKTYDTLFFGPLPAVNANALTNLNALNIDGIIPEANLPANIAFQDRENIFNESNFFIFDDEEDDDQWNSIKLGYGTVDENEETGERSFDEDDILSWLRIGSFGPEEFYISQNFKWNGADYLRDNDALDGVILEFADGEINFKSWLPADLFDYPDPYLADTWKFKTDKSLWMRTYEQDDDMNIIHVDAHWDIIYLADSAGTFTDDWKGFVAIPNKTDTALPVLDGAEPNRLDGIIAIDKTNQRLCYYTNGDRFEISGVPF